MDKSKWIRETSFIIHIPVYALHRDPENFPERESFKPETFLAQNRSCHPFSYLPFGAGPLNCVARRLALIEAKLALLYSVYNFKLSTTEKTDVNIF
jgi:cytochrome P450